jgi:hypothetical protein
MSLPTTPIAVISIPIMSSANDITTANSGAPNIIVNYGGSGNHAIEKLVSLSPGEKVLLSPPENSALQSVTVTADHGLSVTKAYRIPLKIPGMMGS